MRKATTSAKDAAVGQPEEHQNVIGYDGKQRYSYREIPENFQLYQCLFLNAMEKTI